MWKFFLFSAAGKTPRFVVLWSMFERWPLLSKTAFQAFHLNEFDRQHLTSSAFHFTKVRPEICLSSHFSLLRCFSLLLCHSLLFCHTLLFPHILLHKVTLEKYVKGTVCGQGHIQGQFQVNLPRIYFLFIILSQTRQGKAQGGI